MHSPLNISLFNKTEITIVQNTTSFTVDAFGTEVPVRNTLVTNVYIKKLKSTIDPQTGKPILNLSGYPVCLYFLDIDPATIKFNSYEDKLDIITYDSDGVTPISRGRFTLKEIDASQISTMNSILGYRWFGFLERVPL